GNTPAGRAGRVFLFTGTILPWRKQDMWTIFNRKRSYSDLAWMHVDMHSHILPGLDDGCQHASQSQELLERLEALGLKKFYFTPHIMQDMYPNTAETIGKAFYSLRQEG